MNITMKDVFEKWKEYTLENDHGISVSILDFGGIITKLMVPDQKGQIENIVLGYRDYRDYESNNIYLGAIIGRVAGRIQKASFELESKMYQLDANNGKNHLHGGTEGFHHVLWDAIPFQTEKAVGVELIHKSVDTAGGYPGNIEIIVTYTLTNDNKLIMDYSAISDQTTPLTLTNHSYFNLSGNLKNTVEDHHINISSSRFVELDEELIPTGSIVDVEGTPFDFRNEGMVLRTGFRSSNKQNRIVGNGYDHYFIFDEQDEIKATVKELASGREMTIRTNQPGMVMYSSNTMDDRLALRERSSGQYLGVCFETQASPASLHHRGFPSVILQAGEKYEKQTVFSFGFC